MDVGTRRRGRSNLGGSTAAAPEQAIEESEAALALALALAERLLKADPAEAAVIAAEIDRLYADAGAEDMQWLLSMREGLVALCAAHGITLD